MVRTHTVVAGETLSALALRFYGDAELYRLIATASGIADPNVINVGQRLIMPDFTRYTVVAGDTLSALALRFYGDAELDWLIAGASGIADPNVINVGQRLIIPDITRYTVVAGDTMSGLAVRFYGDAAFYPLIATVNGIADPAVIDVGHVLVIFVGRSDGFGLTIVDRNENDPRLWYYRFQTSAIGWNPGVNVLLPDDYRTSGRTYPVLYMFHGGNDDFRQFDFLGIRDLTAGKPIIVVMPDGGHAGWYSNPVSSFVGPRNWETFHIAQLLPWIEANFRTYAEYDGRAVVRVFDGWLRCAEVRSQVLRPLRLGEQPTPARRVCAATSAWSCTGRTSPRRSWTWRAARSTARRSGTRPGSAPTTRSSVSTATGTSGSSWSPAPVRTRSTGSTA